MEDFEYSFSSLKNKYSNWVGFLVGMAIVAAVCEGVALYAGERGPKGLDACQPWFIGAAAGFSLIAAWLWYRKRFTITVSGQAGRLTIMVPDPDLAAPLYLQSPFTVYMQWLKQSTGKRSIYIHMAYITFCDEHDQSLLTFKGAIGTLYDVPGCYEYIALGNGDVIRKLRINKNQYSCGKMKELGPLLRGYGKELTFK